MHLASHPPRCTECRKFMPAARSKIVRKFTPPPMEGEDDYETGVCGRCEYEADANEAAFLAEDAKRY